MRQPHHEGGHCQCDRCLQQIPIQAEDEPSLLDRQDAKDFLSTADLDATDDGWESQVAYLIMSVRRRGEGELEAERQAHEVTTRCLEHYERTRA
jgi:hypothetical protein